MSQDNILLTIYDSFDEKNKKLFGIVMEIILGKKNKYSSDPDIVRNELLHMDQLSLYNQRHILDAIQMFPDLFETFESFNQNEKKYILSKLQKHLTQSEKSILQKDINSMLFRYIMTNPNLFSEETFKKILKDMINIHRGKLKRDMFVAPQGEIQKFLNVSQLMELSKTSVQGKRRAIQFMKRLTMIGFEGVVKEERINFIPRIADLCPNLRILNLDVELLNSEPYAIGPQGAEVLASILPRLTKLESLNLSANEIGDAGAESLARTFSSLSNLTSLFLSWNFFNGQGIGFRNFIRSFPPSLTQLDLSSAFMDDPIFGPVYLAEVFPILPNLQILDLSNTWIHPRSMIILARVLPIRLTKLDLSNNELGDLGTLALANKLLDLQSLTELKILNGRCSNNSIIVLLRNLPSTLKILSLSNGNIPEINFDDFPRGITHLSLTYFKIHQFSGTPPKGLISLKLSSNDINDLGAIFLSETLPSSLIELDLDDNKIGVRGAYSLVTNLVRSKKYLNKNAFTLEGFRQFYKITRNRKKTK